jgi:hypothetical protein
MTLYLAAKRSALNTKASHTKIELTADGNTKVYSSAGANKCLHSFIYHQLFKRSGAPRQSTLQLVSGGTSRSGETTYHIRTRSFALGPHPFTL